MSYAGRYMGLGYLVGQASKVENTAKKAGIVRRAFEALIESRQEAIDRQVARFLAARQVERSPITPSARVCLTRRHRIG